jgi:hypothetical protein
MAQAASGPVKRIRGGAQFDQIRVFELVAERTGTVVDRNSLRGNGGVCRSLTTLTRLARRMGDGYFYLPVVLWPEGVTQLSLATSWTPMS